jgi:hypothetical protein
MSNTLFHGPSNVYLQGEEAVEIVGLRDDYAEYKMLGFKFSPVTIRDYRPEGIGLLRRVLETNDGEIFADGFCRPALVTLTKNGRHYLVELRETDDPKPWQHLWMAVGQEDRLPVYDYSVLEIRPMGKDRFSWLAVYEHDPDVIEVVGEQTDLDNHERNKL